MRIGLGALALIAAVAAFAAPANAATRCKPGRTVLARKRGQVVIWATLTRRNDRVTSRVYVCVWRFGGAHVVDTEAGNAHPKVTRLQVAGNFIGFFLSTAVPFNVGPLSASGTDTTLYVFDAGHRRVDLRDFAVCASGSSCAFVPVMTSYVLAPNGWVAEQYDASSAEANVRELVATDAPSATRTTRQTVPLDFDSTISGVALSGDTLSWTGDLSGGSSAVLGSSLVPSSAPQAVSPCQLLATAELNPVVGPASSSGSPSGCQYTSQSNPSKTLSLSVKSGLSSQQVKSDASALQNNDNFSQLSGYGYGYSLYLGNTTTSGVSHDQLMFFSTSNGAEVSLDLTAPSGNAAEQLPWLANVAFDRLFAVPVQRAT